MIGMLVGGPYDLHGFEYPLSSVAQLHDHDSGGLLAVCRVGADVRVRGGTRFPEGALERAIYRDDPDLSRMHGWLMLPSGDRHRVSLFSFDREWTARLR